MEVAGPLISSTSLAFQEQIRLEIAPVVILDMSGVEHVDSNGVGTLAMINMSFQRENRQLAVVGLTQKVHRILEVTRVLSVLTVFRSELEAEEALVTPVGDSEPTT